MVEVILSRQAPARAWRNGETYADAMVAVLWTEAGRQLEELRVGRHGGEWANRWQEELAPKRATARERARREEREWARSSRSSTTQGLLKPSGRRWEKTFAQGG